MVRSAHQVVLLMIECGVEEEPVVLELEVLVLFADPALSKGEKLFALGEGSHGNGPFLKSNWHRYSVRGWGY